MKTPPKTGNPRSTQESRERARDFLAERLKNNSTIDSERAHRDAARIARDAERRKQEK